TLHHYDRLNLLRPAVVDSHSGYRYYELAQRERLQQILDLKALGLSLDAIAEVLRGEVSTEAFCLLLKNKRCELLEKQAVIQTQITLIENRLTALSEDNMSSDQVTVKTVDQLLVAAQHVDIPTNGQVPDLLRPAFSSVINYVIEQQGQLSGPSIAVWHSPHDAETNESVDAAVQLIKAIPPTEAITIHKLPAVEVASVIHRGRFDDFPATFDTLIPWIDQNGYAISGPYREVYHQFHPDHLGDTVIEIQIPIIKV
ncbi:MAG: MerR family transcriptional regulator, partial [Chloroflexota bacterium]